MLLESSPQEQRRTSRPLRTGASYVLVVPSRRVVARRWDKIEYEAGGECRMSIHGQGLGKDPLSVTVESENEDGTWTPVARLQAEVADGEEEATVSWKLPDEPVVRGEATLREADGSVLSHARFEDPRDLEGGAVWMQAQAEGFEGKSVQVVLEREGDAGQWLTIGQAVATVRSGALRTAVDLDTERAGAPTESKRQDPAGADAPAKAEASLLSDARFEDVRDLEEGGTVWMVARAPGMDGRCVQVLLEREGPSGEWVLAGQATATVRAAGVRASVTPEPTR